MKPWRSGAGQIVIPALLLFPTLFLFVYLIYETAKLSREKIRHQFAMDAAVFVEATNYSDFLNRTAYVNGAFPMRIFEEMYSEFNVPCEGKMKDCDKVTYSDLLYQNGIFPRSKGGHGYKEESYWNSARSWDIEYGGSGLDKNESPLAPDMPTATLFTYDNAQKYWITWDMATEVYKLYVQVFSLLGSVEHAQKDVLDRLTKDHSFLQKSYWLNTGEKDKSAELAKEFGSRLGQFNEAVQTHCLEKLMYYGNEPNSSMLEYRLMGTKAPGETLKDSAGCEGRGLFQMATVNQGVLDRLRNGLPLSMEWEWPKNNYFNIKFHEVLGTHPKLRATVSVAGAGHDVKASVWPDPTPKFQVRQFP